MMRSSQAAFRVMPMVFTILTLLSLLEAASAAARHSVVGAVVSIALAGLSAWMGVGAFLHLVQMNRLLKQFDDDDDINY